MMGRQVETGVALQSTEQPVDTSTAAGNAFFDMLGAFAEFETNLHRERQMEGITAAKARAFAKVAGQQSFLSSLAGCTWRRG